ncbi:Ig-like domain-containing protein, partial [Psychrobacter piscatorii]|uniref:Ig-like domain-containing protein n=1 Tax=Psychrobacter piscatorii TaxID=554343 RepID=UPI0037366E6E
MKTITVKANNQVGTVAEHTVVTQNNIPTVIRATDKTNYELLDTASGRAPKNIVTKRVDKDLHISFENNSENADLIIEGFYDDIDGALVGVAEDGSYYYYLPDTGDVTDYVTELQVGEVQGQSLGGDGYATPWWIGATESEGFAALPWLLGLAGVGVAAAALGGGSNNNDDDNSEADTTAPDAPSIDAFDGTTVTGNAEPGSRVDILDTDDNVIGTVIADATTGAYEVTLNTPLANGEAINAVATDAAGNTSAESDPINAPDTTAPDAPSIVIGNGDALITADEISDNQVTISIGLPDNASVGDTVTVNGVDQQLTNDDIANSTATVTIDAPLEGQSLQVTASITDLAGNESTAVTASATRDTDDAPEAPDSVAIGNGDAFITADEIEGNQVDVVVDLPESSSVGYTVIVNGVEKVLTDDDIEAGNVEVEIPAPEEGAVLEVSVRIEDTAGNVSPAVTANAIRDTTAPDTPPAAPVITDNVDGNGDLLDPAETIPDDGITNDNTPGVVIPDDELANGTPTLLVDGVAVPATLVDNTLTPDTPLADDTYDISYTITDAAGNVSEPSPATTITVDTVAPGGEVGAAIAAPVVVIDDEADDGVNAAEFADGVQTQVTLPTGTVAGDTVTLTVTLPDSSTITVDYIVTADDLDANGGNGIADVTIANDADDGITADGEYSVIATVTDAAGNVSAPSAAVDFTVDTAAPDTPPAAPVITDNVDGNGDLLDPA